MNNIVEGLGLILAALALACFIGYFKGWICCDGGIISSGWHSQRNKVDKKLRQQIRKMVVAEREAKRLAEIATNDTGEDPNEYIKSVRNLLFPIDSNPPQPTPISDNNSHADPVSYNWNENWQNGDDNNIITGSELRLHPIVSIATTTDSSVGINRHSHVVNLEFESEPSYDSEFDEPPSYEECMKNNKLYHFV